MSWLNGYKTYMAAVGLFGLAVYQISTGDYAQAVQSLMAALAAAGVRHAIAMATVLPEPPKRKR